MFHFRGHAVRQCGAGINRVQESAFISRSIALFDRLRSSHQTSAVWSVTGHRGASFCDQVAAANSRTRTPDKHYAYQSQRSTECAKFLQFFYLEGKLADKTAALHCHFDVPTTTSLDLRDNSSAQAWVQAHRSILSGRFRHTQQRRVIMIHRPGMVASCGCAWVCPTPKELITTSLIRDLLYGIRLLPDVAKIRSGISLRPVAAGRNGARWIRWPVPNSQRFARGYS